MIEYIIMNLRQEEGGGHPFDNKIMECKGGGCKGGLYQYKKLYIIPNT